MAEALDLKPRVLVHSLAGDFVLDPWAGGQADLSRYGITGYEVVWGVPEIAPEQSLSGTLTGAGLAAVVVLGALALGLAARRGG